MADAEEDNIPRGPPAPEEIDLSDETQDFRFLASISKSDTAIPKRGEKDFEPHATALQSNTLAASRQAMHNALSFQRVHAPKGQTLATYHPETNMAYAVNPKGTLFSKMGHVRSAMDDPIGNDELRGQRLWLLPEEALYLLERGTLDVRWPPVTEEDDVERSTGGLPMSLQGAYAMFIGDEEAHDGALTFERYSVYASLKRLGYTITRAPSWDGPGLPLGKETYPSLPLRRTWQPGLLLRPGELWKTLFTPRPETGDYSTQQPSGPLIEPGLYRSYSPIYRRLALISWHDPTALSQPDQPMLPTTDPAFRITFHVWKPGSATFKKTAPGPPDFRIAVINARETAVPTLDQLSSLLDTTPYDPHPNAEAHLYAKLKHGYKNVILAVVDQGVTSYLRVAEVGFGKEKVYERHGRPMGGKRGGRGGGRGGRGRGR